MNKKYILSLAAVIVFSLTTVRIVFLLLDPLKARSVGLTDTLAAILVWANFICLAVALVIFYWQRAHRKSPAKDVVETLEAYAEEQLRPAAQPEARIVLDDLLQKLNTPYEVVTVRLRDHPSLQEIHANEIVKLTSVAAPGYFVVVEVVSVNDDEIVLRSIS